MGKLLRRRRVWIAAAFLATAVAVGILWPAAPRISRANFDKIERGWTLAQVQELLGEGMDVQGVWYWGDVVGDTIVVELDAGRRVAEKRLTPDNLTPQQRLYRRTRSSIRGVLNLPPEP